MNDRIQKLQQFFTDQGKAQDREHMKSRKCKMKDLFASDFLNLGTVVKVNEQTGHIVVRFAKGCAPRLKYLKGFVVVKKAARDALGERVFSWECSFDDFVTNAAYHTQSSDIQAIYYTKGDDSNYDYVGCGSITVEMYSFLKSAVDGGKAPQVILFENYPPKEFYTNMSCFIEKHSEEKLLNSIQKLDFDSWDPEHLEYDDANPSIISDTILKTLESEDCCILQGPPGTGKSYTIAQVIASYLQDGKSVCSTTMTNKGLMELCQQDPLAGCVAKGLVSKTRLSADEMKRLPGLQPEGKKISCANGRLVCTTNYILSSLYTQKSEDGKILDFEDSYDLIVIEEASQTFLTTILAFQKLGKKCLIVGDPRQLPPIVSGQDNPLLSSEDMNMQCHGMEAFALSTGTKSYVVTTSFRLTPRSAIQTSLFYKANLKSVQKKPVDFSAFPSSLFPLEGGGLYHVTNNMTDSICSRKAKEIMKKVIDVFDTFYKDYELAIITPFKDSVKPIQREFQNGDRKAAITIETIDRVQGMTVDYCILYIPGYNPSFALEERRFNVATSRSRSTTLIISDVDLENLMKFKGAVKEYVNSCKKV